MPIVYWGHGPKVGPKTLFIFNPVAGASRNYPREWGWLMDQLRLAGYELGEFFTEHAGDATRASRLAIQDRCQLVIVAGGDGTINEAIQALAGTEVALAIIPAGSTNVLAAELGIPSDFE
jgi:diacylglycerol kinase family enzyme